jgi:hypothetical protein
MTSARCGCAIIVQACDRRCCSCCVESQHHLKKHFISNGYTTCFPLQRTMQTQPTGECRHLSRPR